MPRRASVHPATPSVAPTVNTYFLAERALMQTPCGRSDSPARSLAAAMS